MRLWSVTGKSIYRLKFFYIKYRMVKDPGGKGNADAQGTLSTPFFAAQVPKTEDVNTIK